MNRLLAVSLCVVLSAGLGACSDAPKTSPVTPTATRPSRIEVGNPIEIDLGRDTGPVSIDATHLIFVSRHKRDSNLDLVTSVDLTSGKKEIVARTGFRHGMINFAAVSGDWTVYVDQSAQQSDFGAEVLWRIIATNPRTGEHRLLATNKLKPDPFVPIVKAEEGYVFWIQGDGKHNQQNLWRPEWPAPRVLQRDVPANATGQHIDGDWLTYLGPEATPSKKEYQADCWRVPLNGGAPEALTHSGLAMDCMAGADWIVWAEHIDPNTKVVPPDYGILADPYKLFAQRPGQPIQGLHQGYLSASYGLRFGEFVGWVNMNDHAVLTSLEDPRVSRTLPGATGVDPFLAEGNVVVIEKLSGPRTIIQVYDLSKIRLSS